MYRRLSFAAIVAGVIAQLSGLAVDSVLHARDAGLAEHEGVLSLGNPGHLLFAGGLSLTVFGVCALFVAPVFTERRRGVSAWALGLLPAVALVAAAGGSLTVAQRHGALTGHTHADAAASDHHHDDAHVAASIAAAAPIAAHDHGTAPATAASSVTTEGSRHQHGDEVNVSWEQLHQANVMLDTARAATEKYQDVNVARADGYMQVTQVVPGLGAHFINPRIQQSATFDPAHPAILLYDRDVDGSFELVGVSWYMPKKPGDETPPEPVFGPLATWHYHTDLCFGARGGSPVVTVNTPPGCRAAGGVFVKETGWMVHAWIFRPSPEGVFSHQNSTIKGSLPLSANH